MENTTFTRINLNVNDNKNVNDKTIENIEDQIYVMSCLNEVKEVGNAPKYFTFQGKGLENLEGSITPNGCSEVTNAKCSSKKFVVLQKEIYQ